MAKASAGTFFESFRRRLIPGFDRHLADQALAELFCGQLSLLKRWTACQHLSECSYCRIRKETLEGPRAERMLEIYRDSIVEEDASSHEESRNEFVVWLEMQSRLTGSSPSSSKGYLRFPGFHFPPGIPALSLGIVLGVLVGATGWHFWWLEHVPHITANALLVRAEKGQLAASSSGPGVVYQSVQIKAPKELLIRKLYRDVQAKHKPKPSPPRDAKAQTEEEQLRSEFSQAGVDWEEPLSASSYQAWHDRQHERSDRVAFGGKHVLTLTTSVPQGEILKETLTVRASDFHPIRRAVEFRDRDTVEIAELDYKVLPWSAVGSDVFEPVAEMPRPIASANPSTSLPLPDSVPNADQLDETELGARLILNELHADAGEQIEIRRTDHEVEVVGLVETDERKNELRQQLTVVPRLKVSIQSAADARNTPAPEGQGMQVESTSLADVPSALDVYMRARGHSVDEVNAAASQLLGHALALSHESNALADLQIRFGPAEDRPVIISATVTNLFYSHRERLNAALVEQRAVKALIEGERAPLTWEPCKTADAQGPRLNDNATRNLSLVRELTQTSVPSTRDAAKIFSEMSGVMDCLREAAGDFYSRSQRASAPSGKE